MTTRERLSASLVVAALIGVAITFVSAETQTSATPHAAPGLAKATFAGGCFWCMEPPFDELDGVISTAAVFWAAEDYHQDYYLNNPLRYKWYRFGCGRDRRLEELWGDTN